MGRVYGDGRDRTGVVVQDEAQLGRRLGKGGATRTDTTRGLGGGTTVRSGRDTGMSIGMTGTPKKKLKRRGETGGGNAAEFLSKLGRASPRKGHVKQHRSPFSGCIQKRASDGLTTGIAPAQGTHLEGAVEVHDERVPTAAADHPSRRMLSTRTLSKLWPMIGMDAR